MVVTTFTGPILTLGDLSPEREEQNPNTGQPHEHTPGEKRGKNKETNDWNLCFTHDDLKICINIKTFLA